VPFCRDCLVEIQGRPYCATCKTEQLLDVRSGVDRTTITLASNWKRFGAIFVDGLIVGLPSYLLFILLPALTLAQQNDSAGAIVMMVMWIPYILAQPTYEALMFQYKNGQTLGKMALKVRVVRPDGSPLTVGQAWGRAFAKLLLGCISIFDYLPALFTAEKTTIHDLVAGTRVIDHD
jgi:uncharacterized RDD family membrane protein YckC